MGDDMILNGIARIANDLNPDALEDDIATYYIKGMLFCLLWPILIGAWLTTGIVFIYLVGVGLGIG